MTLIERIEAAPEGSREMDAEIARAAYPDLKQGGDGLWYISGTHVRIEPYTTSIDARLPDENIVETKLKLSGKWIAMHARNGVACNGEGHTEALARRAAALRARETMENDDG